MKKRLFLAIFLIMAMTVAACLTACNDSPVAGTEATTVTEEPTATPSEGDSETSTEASADTETTETDTEASSEEDTAPAETALFENGSFTSAEPVAGSAPLSKPYSERITTTEGKVALSNAGVNMSFNSLFYGHDSAIDRDMIQYGWTFTINKLDESFYRGEFFLGEVTGDRYQDMVRYADGVLTVYPAVVKTNKTFEYNGKIYDSVYGDGNSEYTFGEAITYALSLPEATLRGTGDFDGNGYCDMLFVQADGTILLGLVSEDGIAPTTAGVYHGDPAKLFSGDVNADGKCDLIMIDGYTVTSILNTDEGFSVQEPTVLSFTNSYGFVTVGDINSDRRADIVWFEEETCCYRTMFGRGDCYFGPRADLGEGQGNTNLYAVTERLRMSDVQWFAVGDLSGDGVADILVHAEKGLCKGLALCIDVNDPPYDYSLFGMVTEDGTYKMFAGGRWYDHSDAVKDHINGVATGDGDHVLMYTSQDGITWDRYIDGPTFYLGGELGYSGDMGWNETWWIGNTLEPEVVYVDGVYHMLLQTTGITPSGHYGDYINYASSTDGIHFTRKTDSPVVLPEPGKDFTQFKEVYGYEIGFNHHELIYVPDDPDGKCFHLYAGHHVNGAWSGYVRIRSADPTTFYWSDRETTGGIAQIGNQIGYISNYDGNGNRLYLRITFCDYEDEDGWRTVPTLQYSTDGLGFHGTGIRLASVDVTDPSTEMNHNVYFLGFCTVNGTGEIQRNEDGSFKLIYLATTAANSGGLPIFWAEAGVGVLNFTLEG